jgi:hypothetical protein
VDQNNLADFLIIQQLIYFNFNFKEQFDWAAYRKRDKPPEQVGDWIEGFKVTTQAEVRVI